MSMSIAARDDSDPIADMNTTPLVDVMLVLLILFIITLPVLTNTTSLHIGGGPEGPPPREAISLSIDFDGTILWNGALVQGKWASVHTGAPDRTAHREGRPMEPYKVKGVKSRIRVREMTREEIHNPAPDVFADADAENRRFKSISAGGVGGYYHSLEMAGPEGKGVRVLAASTDKGHILGGYSRYAQDGTLIYESRALDIVCRVNGEWLAYEAFKKFGANIHHDHTNDERA